MANKLLNTRIDARVRTVNDSYFQRNVYVLDAPLVAQNDTIEFTFGDDTSLDASNSNDIHRMLLSGVFIWTHDGGLTNTVNANWAVNNGDTIIFEVNDPDGDPVTDIDYTKQKNTWLKRITHTLSGVTNGAATAAQVKASLASDTELSKWVYVESGVTANRVSIFPKGMEGKVQVVGGTAQAVILFPQGTLADNRLRTYTYAPIVAADWTMTFNGSTKKLIITRANAVSATKVLVKIQQF